MEGNGLGRSFQQNLISLGLVRGCLAAQVARRVFIPKPCVGLIPALMSSHPVIKKIIYL
jgi:hypothetical protein